ncbi:MAG: dihydropteroate synthase [Candidatus Omnitrophica bacterium]|nr:dihydropteroate synthase [Candidatus Omnitrophota bacterium]
MFIIGELINGMYNRVRYAIRDKDKSVIQSIACEQAEAGVDALDINCGPLSKDAAGDMRWLIECVQEVTDKPLSLDSSKPEVIEAGLRVARNECIINSTTADAEKLDRLVPLAVEHNARLIGIAISSGGIPRNREQRVELAAVIVADCLEKGLGVERLFLDPIVLPVKVAQSQMGDILETIRDFKIIADPAPLTLIGLSNVSQGAQNRRLLNRVFLSLAQAYGLDAAILDPCDRDLVDELITGELFRNKQIYCDSFLDAYRKR